MAKGTCKECGGEFKNLGAHMRKHKGKNSSSASSPAKSRGAPSKVRYFSSRSPSLRINVVPSRRAIVDIGNGKSANELLPGVFIQFVKGVYETSDPKMIDFLDNVYNDRRYPVTNMTKLGS